MYLLLVQICFTQKHLYFLETVVGSKKIEKVLGALVGHYFRVFL